MEMAVETFFGKRRYTVSQ